MRNHEHGISRKEQIRNRYLLLQINDALFPIGGYSHSYGMETYIQKGLVTDTDSAGAYIRSNILCNICYTDLLAVRWAYEYAGGGKVQKLLELDVLLSAVKAPFELRSASQKLGVRFAKTVKNFEIPHMHEIFAVYLESQEKKHHTTIYGAFCGAIGADYEEMMAAFLYAQVSAMVTNAVKLVPLSQTDGQNLLAGCHDVMQAAADKVKELGMDEFGASTPGFDLRSMQHEGLYSRLYMS